MTDFLLTAAFFCLGYFFQTLFGFGAAFIIVLGLSLFIPIQPVIGMIPVSLLAVIAVAVIQDRQVIQWGRILKIFLISLPGVVVGSIVLDRVPSRIIVIGVCIIILVWSLYSLAMEPKKIPRMLRYPLMLVSGFVIGSAGMGITYVPLVIQDIEDPRELRASLNLLWLLLGLARLPMYFINGIINTHYALIGLSVIPFMLLAQVLGRKLHKRIHPEHFHRMVLVFLSLLVLARLVSELF